MSVIATPRTKCDVVLTEKDEYFFEVVEINDRNVVVSIEEAFDYKNGLSEILDACFDPNKDTDEAFENSLDFIDSRIFSLEVKENYEDFLLIYDTIEGKLQEGEDGLIISGEESTIKAIIDTTLMAVDERNFLDYKTANFFEGVHSPDGFYIRKCFCK